MTLNKEETTVFVVSSSPIIRVGLEALVTSTENFVLSGSAAKLTVLFEERAFAKIVPEILLYDVDLRDDQFIETLQTFFAQQSEGELGIATKVVLLLPEFVADAEIIEFFKIGVSAVLSQTAEEKEIKAVLQAVEANLFVISRQTLGALLPSDSSNDLAMNSENRSSNQIEALTPREIEVLEMLAEGASNKFIARALRISEHTVKFHVASIFAKLNATNRTEAVTVGVRNGLVML